MEVQINWLAVVLAALSTMVVGSVWYAKPVFGTTWMKLIGKTDKDLEKAGMVKPIAITLVASLATAYVLAHITYFGNSFYKPDYTFLESGLTSAFFVWLGFVAARFVTHDVFEGRSHKLTLLNVAHEFVTLMVMGLIIGLLKP